MNFIGTGRRLTPEDLQRAADLIGCDVPTVQAVLDVESRGRGFGDDNRPIVLFEPHVFWRLLGKTWAREEAEIVGVAYEKWGTRPYPQSQRARYEQLDTAIAIDQDKGLQSASWGLGQVMGFNFAPCGYADVLELVEGAKLSEGEQLMAMARFIQHAHLDQHLRAREWASFARGYNGSGFARNKYDERLADAYRKRSAAA